MRRLILVIGLVIGFFVVAGRPGAGFRVVGVAVAGVMTGFTLTLSDYAIGGFMDSDGASRLASDRRELEAIDWGGRLAGFGLLGWLAWRRFGRSES